MIDHISIGISCFTLSKNFYDASFAALGYQCVMYIPEKKFVAYGSEKNMPIFEMTEKKIGSEQIGTARGVHFGFLAPSPQCIDEWYKACLQHGGTDNGKPGPRPEYHPGYYGAFIVDPDGWRIEACYHEYRGK